jgi:P-type Ca2+ transporter type 2C
MRLLHQRRGAGHRGARPRRKSLRRHKGLDGVARKVNVSLADGVKSDDTVVRGEVYGASQDAEKPPRTFWMFMWDAAQDMTLQ